MKWYWWHVRRAKIERELRNELDLYGETVIAFALGAGKMPSIKLEFEASGTKDNIAAWLIERRDIAERDRRLSVAVEIAILLFVILGVITDAFLFAQERHWLPP
jgi:hypothetical protein